MDLLTPLINASRPTVIVREGEAVAVDDHVVSIEDARPGSYFAGVNLLVQHDGTGIRSHHCEPAAHAPCPCSPSAYWRITKIDTALNGVVFATMEHRQP
jgi:hypothetical protein